MQACCIVFTKKRAGVHLPHESLWTLISSAYHPSFPHWARLDRELVDAITPRYLDYATTITSFATYRPKPALILNTFCFDLHCFPVCLRRHEVVHDNPTPRLITSPVTTL